MAVNYVTKRNIGGLNEIQEADIQLTDVIQLVRAGSFNRKMTVATLLALVETSDSEKIVEVTGDYVSDGSEDVIFASGTLTVTYPDVDNAIKPLTVRNNTGAASTVTLASAGGTIEITSLTDGQSTTQAPATSGWFEI